MLCEKCKKQEGKNYLPTVGTASGCGHISKMLQTYYPDCSEELSRCGKCGYKLKKEKEG